MQLWRKVWRVMAVQAGASGLYALLDALEADDSRLTQMATTLRRPEGHPAGSPLELPPLGACALALCGWLGDGLTSVAEVEEYFGRMCQQADATLGETGAARWFLNWYDETPRAVMRELLLSEVRFALGLGADPAEAA